MARLEKQKSAPGSGGIRALFVLWVLCIAAALLCYQFLPRSGDPGWSPNFSYTRAFIILGLAGIAVLDSIVAAIKTFRRRRGLTVGTKSLGYSPFFFTTGSIGTLLERLLSE